MICFYVFLIKKRLVIDEALLGIELGKVGYTEKLSPHAHVRDALGLLNSKPLPFNPSE